jgi:putative oxidoreductase
VRRLTDTGLLFLRVGIGGTILGVHGWARLMKAFSYLFQGQQWTFIALVQRMGFPMPAAFAVASALAESLGAALLIAGLGTRWAALVVGFNLAVAVGLELSKHSAAIELPAVYLIAVTAIGIAGAGCYSLDARLRSPARVGPDYAAKR